jgi:hypothetical protein
MAAAGRRPPIVALGLLGGLLLAAAFAAPRVLPDTNRDDLVTRQTARVAVLFWGLAAAALLLGRREFARAAWAVGAATFLVHVATAFDRIHGWSHAAAFRHVESVGGFGAGVFVSYAFTLVWAADAVWWWLDGAGYARRPAWLDRLVHGFLAFVVFNATVVYEAGFVRWVGVALFILLGLLIFARRARMIEPRP